jgi:hypothetical protein
MEQGMSGADEVKANEVREERKVHKVLLGSPKERVHWEDQGVDGKMGSEWILGRLAGGSVEWI